ncbi:uncharacterized protein BX664DRAFT_333692 [Halteromyces radiatus]|uniref:uncharacterized protein n=1 Tax=Halteromyces radiatus TaxID=101107 RepID=UPI00222095C7|nr:uncharacterized protein BX664DRAFT_333692 [Halteromyces radiatus]KAI8089709.1 hypothetical protein BX664DRAFT_333692 [Halteromyces radiatus]
MTTATGTRVFFVESTAHWEALQRERAQFHTTTISPEPIQQYKKTKHTSSRQSPSQTNRPILLGKEGSRRRKRWENNNLKDNPLAVLYTEDLKPPGHQQNSSPNTKYLEWQSLPENMKEDMEMIKYQDNTKDDNKTTLPSLTRQMRIGLKKHHIPEGWITFYEQQLLQFLSQQRQYHQEQDVTLLKNNNNNTLIWEIDDSYLRFIGHAICRYYNVNSYTETTLDGRKITFVECLDIDQLHTPSISFFDYIKNK